MNCDPLSFAIQRLSDGKYYMPAKIDTRATWTPNPGYLFVPSSPRRPVRVVEIHGSPDPVFPPFEEILQAETEEERLENEREALEFHHYLNGWNASSRLSVLTQICQEIDSLFGLDGSNYKAEMGIEGVIRFEEDLNAESLESDDDTCGCNECDYCTLRRLDII